MRSVMLLVLLTAFFAAGCVGEPRPAGLELDLQDPELAICASFSADGKTLLTGEVGEASRVGLRDLTRGKKSKSYEGCRGLLWSVIASPDGKFVASGGGKGEVCVWESETGKMRASLSLDAITANTVVFAPDSSLIAAAGDDRVRIWNTRNFREQADLPNIWSNNLHGLAFSPDGATLAVADSRRVRRWATSNWKEEKPLVELSESISSMAWSPSGKTLALGEGTESKEAALRLIDVSTRCEVVTCVGHTGTILCVCFTKDGRYLVTGSLDGSAKVWDAATGKEVCTLGGNEGEVRAVSVSSDQERIVVAGHHKVRVWRLADLLKAKDTTPPK